MKHINLGFSSWIIFINIILLSILLYKLLLKNKELFINYPQQVNPLSINESNSDIEAANNNYASILMFIKNNPSKSIGFIQDIQKRFFDDSCKVKSNIDFNNITQMPTTVIFS
jgi:hypothetical protein